MYTEHFVDTCSPCFYLIVPNKRASDFTPEIENEESEENNDWNQKSMMGVQSLSHKTFCGMLQNKKIPSLDLIKKNIGSARSAPILAQFLPKISIE